MAKKKKDPKDNETLAAAPSHTTLREWFQQRMQLFADARAHWDEADTGGTLNEAQVLAKQETILDEVAELDKKIHHGLGLLELAKVETDGERFSQRIENLGTSGPEPAGPGILTPSPADETLTRPDWYLDLVTGNGANSPKVAEFAASEEYETFAQQVHDGPKGGFQVPTLKVQGLHRAYPAYMLEGLCRNIFVADYSDVHLNAIVGFAMDKAAYLLPGQEAPKRDYKTERRLLTPIRQTAQNIMDRPMNRLDGYAMEVETEMGLQFVRSTEGAIMNGPDNDEQRAPAGVFTTEQLGLPNTRFVSGDNTATELKSDAWNDCKLHLKSESRKSPSLRWVMHRSCIARVMNLKDADGRRIFMDALKMGEPDMLVGVGIVESEEAPDVSAALTTGQKLAVLGDWRHYVLVHWLNGMVMAFDATQHYTTKGQTGTVFERYNDGGVMTSDGFSGVRMG